MLANLNNNTLASHNNSVPPFDGMEEDGILPQVNLTCASLSQTFFDNSNEVVLSLDDQFRVLAVNKATLSAWGFKPEDMIGRHYSEFVHKMDRKETHKHLVGLMAGASEKPIECRVILKDGSKRDMMWSCKLSEDENQLVCVVIDITERKELDRQKQEIMRLRENFMQMVSHDMRSPLNSFLNFLTMMEEGVYGELNEQGQKRVKGIEDTLSRLTQMINDLLDLEKIDSGNLVTVVKEVETALLCKRAKESIQDLADKKQVSIQLVDSNARVFADQNRIVQVLVNLLSNAIEFSPTSSTVIITARITKDGATMFTVTDRGAGIPENKLDRVFNRFEQLESPKAGHKGSGLGLSIAEAIVKAHGGTIGVNSQVGVGSTFWFCLP